MFGSLATTRLLFAQQQHRAMSTTSKSAAAQQLKGLLSQQLDAIREAGTFKEERVITSPQDARVSVSGRKQQVLNFCANNYLGLSNNPKLVDAAKRAMDTHGLGLSSVRFICGTQDIHKELEQSIAKFHEVSGFEANCLLRSVAWCGCSPWRSVSGRIHTFIHPFIHLLSKITEWRIDLWQLCAQRRDVDIFRGL
jgi:hypothetical protein